MNEHDSDLAINEIVNVKDIGKSQTVIETYETIEKVKNPGEHDSEKPIVFVLNDLNAKETNDPRVIAMFKRSRHSNLSIFIISQDYYELPKKTIRANRISYHMFKPNNFKDVQNLYQDKTSIAKTLTEIKSLTSTGWDQKYQPILFDMNKDKYTCRYRWELKSLFVLQISAFYVFSMSIYPRKTEKIWLI